jgi:hypothetical protein
MKQEVKDKFWVNEAGDKVPVGYINKSDKLKERHAHTLLSHALSLNKRLAEFKALSRRLNDEVFSAAMEDFKVTPFNKGNYTWFNFDRSIKVEVSINERIEFDDLTIKACKEKLDEFLDVNVESKHDFVKQLVTDAFATTRGKLDAKKVMSLLRYEDKIKDALFQESLALLKQSIRRPDSRMYYRISERQDDGSYQSIDLNFSSIN